MKTLSALEAEQLPISADDDMDGLVGKEEELAKLVGRFDKVSIAYGMEISAERTKLTRNNTSGINTEIKIDGQMLETVTSFKYLGSVITNKGSKPKVLSMIAQTTIALARMKPVWNDRSISSRMLVNHLVRQVPEGRREQGKMEETGCEIICGAPAALAVKG